MVDCIYGIKSRDILKIKTLMDRFAIIEVDDLLLCFNEDKLAKLNREKLIKERDRIDKLLNNTKIDKY